MNDPSASQALTPWRRTDLLIFCVATAAGFGLLALAWWVTSGRAHVDDQVLWVSVGGVALIVLGVGNVSWLLLGRRAVADRRWRLLAPFVGIAPDGPVATADNGAGPQPLAALGMEHYHRPSCQLVQGKAAKGASIASHQRAGRRPCGMCQP